ncbi:glycoside hydrolase family 3 protein [[Candida] arabinofermentans NRRL YB-2248]|uniref:Glycoside hydrolase family 3 protein n=1 Tax=[Candida] arabinofermentans NRRL YB-2248 TaxID=983967 RepID=A0A1E4SUJ5_9ASCO|nr:glycoside hydrolase family 3 protein [[Candida] arabinofermentans NRRL YB-2248]
MAENIGKLLLAGFEGHDCLPDSQAEKLIKIHKVHSFMLGTKNFKNATQFCELISSLQRLAYNEGYKHPLVIAIDQELGCCNDLYESDAITQFPGAMALAASGDLQLITDIGEAVAIELKNLGINLYMGPVLDICSKMSNQLIGVRSFGDSVQDVTKYAMAFTKGLKKGGLLSCGKHFPGMGSSFIDNVLELPMLLETSSQLECFNVLPFKNLIDADMLDSVHVGGVAVPNVAPNEIHACLSPIIVQTLLRKNLKYEGVAISECLELESLCRNLGLGQGAVLAILFARCDMVIVCNDYIYQQEALDSLNKAYELSNYEVIFNQTFSRIDKLLEKLDPWDTVLNRSPILSDELWNKHQRLAFKAYENSITLVRDYYDILPIDKFFTKDKDTKPSDNTVLLLTPLLAQIHPDLHNKCNSIHPAAQEGLLPGEGIFQELGSKIAEFDTSENYTVSHTSYTANGLTNLQEQLIDKAKVVILVCAEASRNMFQIGIAKHINALCSSLNRQTSFQVKKPMIVISVASPYDFLYHNGIGTTYICTYDYTSLALAHLPAVLFGKLKPTGMIPGDANRTDSKQDFLFALTPGGVSGSPNVNKSLGMLLNSNSSSNQVLFPSNSSSPLSLVGGNGGRQQESVFFEPMQTRKRKKLGKPWLVEKFDLSRDMINLALLLKNSLHGDSYDPINPRFMNKIHKLLLETNNEQEHFVVRNPTLNVMYGIIFTWVDKNSSQGRILFMAVDRTKRRQSIGEILHHHAVKYLSIDRSCKKIILGSSFPMLGFIAESKFIPDLLTFWHFLDSDETSDTALLNISGPSSLILNFCRSVGWANPKSYRKTFRKELKHVLYLELKDWKLSDKLVKQLKVVGIKFEICNDPLELIDKIKTNQLKEPNKEEESKIVEIYQRVSIQNTGNEPVGNVTDTIIIKAVEPSSNALVGSIILFNNRSELSIYYPFLENIGIKSSDMTCGLTGLFVDSNYESLNAVVKLGLICTGVSFGKRFGMSSLVLVDCSDSQMGELLESGFKVYRDYCSIYGIKNSYEWII